VDQAFQPWDITLSTTPDPHIPPALSEEQRAAAFAQTNTARSAGGAPRMGPTPIPPKFVLFVALAFVVLGVGGAVLEHYYGGVGQPSSTSSTVFTLPPTPVTPSGSQLHAPTRALMGLKEIATAQASPFTLIDQNHRTWNLADAKGKVVVLTFYDSNCNDICRVLGPEIRQAAGMLGDKAPQVEFVIVNSNPNNFRYQANPLALSVPHLQNLSNVFFLTGPLNALNAVWISYGLSVRVGALPSEVAHNNVMYFITPKGQLRFLAVPFGNEDHAGVFSLDATNVHKFAEGIAASAVSLAR
jgi:cytochrome oxidase Cu insertion factor (SCO1/SenC/PrrC family)